MNFDSLALLVALLLQFHMKTNYDANAAPSRFSSSLFMVLFTLIVTHVIIWPKTSHALLDVFALTRKISVKTNAHASAAKSKDQMVLPSERRKFLQSMVVITTASIDLLPVPAIARNLPTSTGADTSQTGTLQALIPIVELRQSLSLVLEASKKSSDRMQFKQHSKPLISRLPTDEITFKRLFDTYSDQVSYKQQFLDSNAFLVYYTQGFDGPNRPSIERESSSGSSSDIVNEKQTIQFGLRNDAWIAWENCLVEYKYLTEGGSGDEEEDNDFVEYLTQTIRAVDSYMSLAPSSDVKAAQQLIAN